MCATEPSEATPVALVYSSPVVVPAGYLPAVPDLENDSAFPEFNDVGAAGLRSKFPARAKYHLAFDGELLPAGRWVTSEDLPQLERQGIDQDTLDLLRAHFRRDPTSSFRIARDPALSEVFALHNDFELAHKRLSVASVKWLFRVTKFARFFSTLERSLLSRQSIPVPLLRQKAPDLERAWSEVAQWIQGTRRTDEVASLLVGVILADVADVYDREQLWLAEAEREDPGFAEEYHALRARFPREEHEDDRPALADAVVEHVQAQLASARVPDDSSRAEELTPGRLRTRLLTWPPLVQQAGVPQLKARVLVAGDRRASMGVPEAVEQLIAEDARRSHQGRRYARRHSWPVYMHVDIDIEEDNIPHIIFGLSYHLWNIITTKVSCTDGSPIDRETQWFIALYTAFIESIRQQLCSGVGLMCPFWNGTCCAFQQQDRLSPARAAVFRRILERTFEITWPRKLQGSRYWRPPLCLA